MTEQQQQQSDDSSPSTSREEREEQQQATMEVLTETGVLQNDDEKLLKVRSGVMMKDAVTEHEEEEEKKMMTLMSPSPTSTLQQEKTLDDSSLMKVQKVTSVPEKVIRAQHGVEGKIKQEQQGGGSNEESSMAVGVGMVLPPSLHRDAAGVRQPAEPGAVAIEGSTSDIVTPPALGRDIETGDTTTTTPPEANLIEAELVENKDDNENEAQVEHELAVASPLQEKSSNKWKYWTGAGLVVVIVVIVLATTLGGDGNGDSDPPPSSPEASSLTESLQYGNTIIGSAPDDRFGAPLAFSRDGTILAVGARNNNNAGEDSGMVRVYQATETAGQTDENGQLINGSEARVLWHQLGNALWGEAAGDEFAFSGMAMNANGTRLAVGAIYHNYTTPNGTTLTNAGNVRIFDLVGNRWEPVGDSIGGLQAFDEFGRAVAMSADGTILAAASYASSENGPNAGNVRIFQQSTVNDTIVWEPMGILLGRSPDERFGRAIDLSADGMRLVVGATQFKADPAGPGYVSVYDFVNGTDWQQVGQDVWGDVGNDQLGRDVAISDNGSVIVCGANKASPNELEEAGLVKMFRYNYKDQGWRQMGKTINGTAEGDVLGNSLAISSKGYRVAVGASQSKTSVGYVLILDWNGLGWKQTNKLQGSEELEKFGTDVQLSSDGVRLAVGSVGSDLNGDDSGHAAVFNLTERDKRIWCFVEPTGWNMCYSD